jgi:hypothetical protein
MKVFVDFWVIDGVVSKAGSNNTNITVMDENLATSLFAPDQLNVPMLQLLSGNGPMAIAEKDASVDRISGWSNGDVCDASDPQYNLANGSGVLTAPPPGGGKSITTTTLVSPMSGVLRSRCGLYGSGYGRQSARRFRAGIYLVTWHGCLNVKSSRGAWCCKG